MSETSELNAHFTIHERASLPTTQGVSHSGFKVEDWARMEAFHCPKIVEFHPDFRVEDWADLEAFYRPKIVAGFLNWYLDLRRQEFINSLMLGLIIGFNAFLSSRHGRMSLIVKKNSKVADLLALAKINRIVNIHDHWSALADASTTNA